MEINFYQTIKSLRKERGVTQEELATCAEANYTPKERHAIRKAVYDMFHLVFSDGDFGFWENRLASTYLYHLNSNPLFKALENDSRLVGIKERLLAMD